LGPVNTITFVDNNRRFVTTSDDKTIRGWDYDIPVVIKYIAEPYMHSMPAVSLHPSSKSYVFPALDLLTTATFLEKYFACQSLDNQILVYNADGSFKQNKKKRFAGHTIAGYACAIGFSPDGKYISSGTGAGDVVFWDFKTGRIVKRLKAHSQVVIDHVWLPNEHVSPASMAGRSDRMLTPFVVENGDSLMGWTDQALDLSQCDSKCKTQYVTMHVQMGSVYVESAYMQAIVQYPLHPARPNVSPNPPRTLTLSYPHSI
jgi:WD40 repeat protein